MSRNSTTRSPSYLFPFIVFLACLSFTIFIIYKVDQLALNTKTIAGHNLEPTPWHLFPPRISAEETRQSRAYKILQCSYLSCSHTNISNVTPRISKRLSFQQPMQCPDYFRWIHQDLDPWVQTRISETHIVESKKYAAFRVVIIDGKLYVDLYYACVQSRAMFTIWGILQLLKRYPGMVPDVDIMFDCMDKPSINRTEHAYMPLPLFRYCTTKDHFDIPFPDWSFWGWPEINIRPWGEEFEDIKQVSKTQSWSKKGLFAHWKGNPDVSSPIRSKLLQCNDSKIWGAQIMRQDWSKEGKNGYQDSRLSNQCNHRYKIYAEGFAWSVSLKYIISCGSLPLIITPKYEDFVSRGLIPMKHYWPVSPTDICPSIRFAVNWGNKNPRKAMGIGKAGQQFAENISIDRVYEYMLHLLSEYSKLQDFKPVMPLSALEVCEESILCLANKEQKELLVRSTTFPATTPPCNLQPHDSNLTKKLMQEKVKTLMNVKYMEKREQKRFARNAHN